MNNMSILNKAQAEKVLPYLAVRVLFYIVAVVSYGVYRALL